MQSKYDEYDYDYEEALSVDSFAAVPAAAAPAAAPAAAAPAAAVSKPSVDAQLQAAAPASAAAPAPAPVPGEDAPPEIVDVDEQGDEYEYGGYYTSEYGAKQG